MRKNKLHKLFGALSGVEDNAAFQSVDKQLAQIGAKLKETMSVKTIEEVNREFKTLQKLFTPLLPAFEALKKDLTSREEQLRQAYKERFDTLTLLLRDTKGTSQEGIQSLRHELASLQTQIEAVQNKKIELPDYTTYINDLSLQFSDKLKALRAYIDKGDDETKIQDRVKELENITKRLQSGFEGRGGSMNRQFFVGGSDALSKYSDINLKAGANVTLTFANNTTTKKAEITIASTGGGGGGTIRSINSISTSQTAGATSGTDYVYLCTGTLTLTLPDATTNTNLYTVKNVGSGIITINTTSSQTIDGALTVVMPVQYTAVDLISDTTNWNVT